MRNINFTESIKISVSSLKENKLRTFLTLLGIIIGVMTVITVVSIISGLNRYVETKLFNFGSNDFMVQRIPSLITSYEKWLEVKKRKRIPYRYYKIVRKRCSSCLLVGARVSSSGIVKYGDNALEDVRISGYTENDAYILGTINLEGGRALIKADVMEGKQVAIIGWDIKDKLFRGIDPFGKYIKLKNYKFKVIGVAEKKGKVLGMSQDNFVIIPITTFFKKFGRRNRSITITVHAESLKMMEDAQDEVRSIMRALRHLSPKDEDDFSMETQQTFLNFYKKTTATLYLVMILISSIALVVGGIVIMNIILVSVTERIREIGIRKAVGARRRDILTQFLIESIFLSVIGGVIGIILGFLIAKIITIATGFPSSVELWSVISGVLIAGIVGLFSGIYPANKAAKLDPVVALRM